MWIESRTPVLVGRQRVTLPALMGAGVVCVAVLLAVFLVPFRIPTPAGVISASVLAGYNNTAAYLLYLLLLPVSGVAVAMVLPIHRVHGDLAQDGARPGLVPIVSVVMVGHLLLFLGLYLVKGAFVFGDAMYFQQVLARMVQGEVPYRDIGFFYGPAMLYPAYWLSRMLGVPAAYAIYYAVMYLGGLALLAIAVRLSVGPAKAAWVFVLCALGFFNHTLGLNYVLARGLLPAAAVVGIWRYLNHPTAGRTAAAAALLLGTLTYSPEMGILAAAAGLLVAMLMVGLPVFAGRAGRVSAREAALTVGRVLGVCTVAAGGLVMLFYLMDPSFQALSGFIRPMVNQVGGAGNRPNYFNLPMLAVVGTSILVVALSLRMTRERPGDPLTALVLSLTVLAILMERMAFGVPDSLHVVNNCLPLFLLGLFLAVRAWPNLPTIRWYVISLVVSVMLPLQVFNLFMFKPYMERKLGLVAAADPSTPPPPTSWQVQQSLDRLIAELGPQRAYYLHALQYYSLPAVLRWRLQQVSYFTILEEAQVPNDFQDLIRALQKRKAIVVTLRRSLGETEAPPWGGWEDWLYQLTASPLPGSRVFSQLAEVKSQLSRPVMEFIQASYRVAAEDGALVALVPK